MCYAMDALENYDSPRQRLATLEEMQAEVKDCNVRHGWYEEGRTFGDDVALLHSEVSEALEAYRTWAFDDATNLPAPMPGCCARSGVGACDDAPHPRKPEGVGSELADVLIRLLDTCERAGINLRAEYVRKMAYNSTRPYKHGGKAL